MADRKIRVALADSHPVTRAGIRAILSVDEDIDVVGEAEDGHLAQRLCQVQTPDVLLLNLNMPGPPAAEVIVNLRRQCPAVKVLVFAAQEEEALVRGMIAAGAAGYMLENEVPEMVARGVRAITHGITWFSPGVVERLARGSEDAMRGASALTPREMQVLALIARGYDNATIASELTLSDQTVRNYISRIYAKLNVDSRVKVMVWGREHGWGEK